MNDNKVIPGVGGIDMQRQSPPKHRHDGTSPLPLGMDWSPSPRIWAGRETVWPHDPHTGWSYCITIPSWVVLAKSRDSDPTVFYRVQVGLQSPEGITTTRTVLRRFNDFLKLHAALKRIFHQKSIPPSPSKGLFRMKTKAMLEERRSSLEEWMVRLLSNIDLSRSNVVASFLELEAAARSAFQEESQQDSVSRTLGTSDSSIHGHPDSSLSLEAGSSFLASEYGSDTAYETSEIGTPSLGRDNNSEIGLEDLSFDEYSTNLIDKFVKHDMSNIDEGLSMGQAIIEKLENFSKHTLKASEIHNNMERDKNNGSSSKTSHQSEDMLESPSDPEQSTVCRSRMLSNESIVSDRSSHKRISLSNVDFRDLNGHGALDLRSAPYVSRRNEDVGDSDYQLPDDVHLYLPMDQRHKINRLLMTMHRRLVTAKTDMEDLVTRLNQESAVKEYLKTKVKDLEVELETTKQKSKENLEQSLMIERERVNQMQWDMEEIRQRSMEMELKLNSQQARRTDLQLSISPKNQQKDVLQELETTKQQFDDLLKRHQELEVKSKADIKVLVKEVKSLRNSQSELKQQLKQSLEDRFKMEELLQEERERNEQTRNSWKKLLQKSKIIRDQLQECNISNLMREKEEDPLTITPFISDPVNVVGKSSDYPISLLIAEIQSFAKDTNLGASTPYDIADMNEKRSSMDEELRSMLSSILIDNAALIKQVNSLAFDALKENELALKKVSNEEENVKNESEEGGT